MTTLFRPAPMPGPGRFIPTSDLQAVRQSPLGAMVRIARQYGDLFQYPVGFWSVYFVNHPDYIRHVLVDHQRNYDKQTFQYKLLGTVAGKGLLTNDGESWLHQRRLAQPAFHRERLAALGDGMVAQTVGMLDEWEGLARSGTLLDVDAAMMTLTLQIVAQSLFGADVSGGAAGLVQDVLTTLDHVIYRARMPFALPEWMPTARNRRFVQARARLEAAMQAIITRRRAQGREHDDLLAMLMAAQDEESGARMSDRQLRDEIITLIIAGHETVASALTWTWYFLSQHPHVQEKLEQEVDSALGGRLPTAADLPRLPYTRMIFEESLRFYPPAWLITRRALAADFIGPYRIPANALVVISPYVMHRHPNLWDDPDVFDPERFRPELERTRPRYAYLPFGGGPRLCIGNHYSYLEAQLVLATVAQRYRLELAGGHPVEVDPLVTIRPKGGVGVRVIRRAR